MCTLVCQFLCFIETAAQKPFLVFIESERFCVFEDRCVAVVSVVQRSFCDFNRVFLKAETERFERVIELIEFCGIVLVGRRFGITHEQRTPRER